MRAATICTLLLIASAHVGSAQPPGNVFVLSGPANWTSKGGPIRATLNKGDVIVANEKGEMELDCAASNRGLVVYSCAEPPCQAQACELTGTRMQIRQRGSLSQLAGWVSALFVREPVRPVIAAARAGGNPSDAVLRRDARGIHWGPALTRVLEGRVCFRATVLPSRPSARPVTVTLDWDRGSDAEGVSQVAAVVPGLYSLEKGVVGASGSCDQDPDAQAAWVLVVDNGDFDRFNAEWKQQQAAIAEVEGAGASTAALVTIRHAALAHLARPFPPQ